MRAWPVAVMFLVLLLVGCGDVVGPDYERVDQPPATEDGWLDRVTGDG